MVDRCHVLEDKMRSAVTQATTQTHLWISDSGGKNDFPFPFVRYSIPGEILWGNGYSDLLDFILTDMPFLDGCC